MMKGVRNRQRTGPGQGKEMLLFIIASVIGIYALGQGLQGVFFPGQEVSLVWLAVAGAAMWVLFAQMARVKDAWPHRPAKTDAKQGDTMHVE